MANFSIKTDLLKLKGAFVTNLKGKTATKRCLIIPVDDAGLFIGEKGVYLNLTAIEMQNPKYSDTHCVKVSLDKERYEAMSEEERKAQPIIGGMKQLERQATEMPVTSQIDGTQAFTDDDLLSDGGAERMRRQRRGTFSRLCSVQERKRAETPQIRVQI